MGSIETFYESVCGEIGRLRDEQWRLAYYFISLSLGILFIFMSPEKNIIIISNKAFGIAAILVQISAILLFTYHMLQTHRYLTMHRAMRRSLEGLLGYQDTKDLNGDCIMPAEWHGNAVDRFFEFNSIIAPLLLFVWLLQLLSIWFAWPTP